MPVDPESFGQHHLAPGVTVVTEAGIVLRGGPRQIASAAYGYTPHWATCTHPEQFRAKRRAHSAEVATMSAGMIIWSTFLFGALVGGIAATVTLCVIMACRETEEPHFSADDIRRLLERVK
jgi:hypothetical protein